MRTVWNMSRHMPDASIKICEIIGWRGAELKDYKDKEQKKRIREMQKIYALPDERTDEEKKRQDEIIAALMGDGDLSNIL